MSHLITEKKIFLTFEISLILKAMQAVLEIVGGLLILFISKSTVLSFVAFLTQEELTEDPRDLISHYLAKTVNDLSVSGQHFISFYLLSHGIIKLILVTGLLQKKFWAYPSAIIAFSLFIIYQMYRYTFTHSPWLLLFTALDVAIIALTVHEYRYLKRKNRFNP